MAKCFFISSLTLLVFFAGCTTVKPEPAQPSPPQMPQPSKTEPPEPGPEQVMPCPSESAEPEPNQVQPQQAQPTDLEPAPAQPHETKPSKVEPPPTEPNEISSPSPEPDAAEPAETEPPKVETTKPRPPTPEPNHLKPPSKVTFHDKCKVILNNFVDDKGMVDYKKLKRKRLRLKKLLDEFRNLDPNQYKAWPQEDKIAFWLNAYNLQMLNIIVDNYPIESSRILRILWGPHSIRHIDKKIGGIWRKKFIIMDEEFTLQEIDHRFFRKQFGDPRLFLAISHASLSSPPLRNEPYYGCQLSPQLEDQAKRFLSSPRAFRIDREDKIVYLSAIFKSTWYGKQFVTKFATQKKFKDQSPTTRAVLNFITKYIPQRDVYFLEVQRYYVKYISYDWTLNDNSPK